MSEEQVPIDTLPTEQFNAAREAGATETVSRSDLLDITPPEVTGEESTKEFEAKRNEQQEKKRGGGGVQRRIDRAIKAKGEAEKVAEALRAENAALKARYENGNGLPTQAGAESQDSGQPESRSESPAEDEIAELRQQIPNFDELRERAKNISASDEVHQALKSLGKGNAKVVLEFARNPDLLAQIHNLPPQQQGGAIRQFAADLAGVDNGQVPLAQKAYAAFSKEEIREVQQGNELGKQVVLAYAKELNELPNAPQVLKHIVTNPEISQKLAHMNQDAVPLELGRISARLEGNGPRFVSKAPPPISPVGGSSTKSTVPMDKMSPADFNRAREAGRVR